MSASFDLLIDGMVEALRGHVLPNVGDEFARGQLFAIIYVLNNLKLTADWKVEPLNDQVAVQDAAFSSVKRLLGGRDSPDIPETPRVSERLVDAAGLERLRDQGDRKIAELLAWAADKQAADQEPELMTEIVRALRRFANEQLAIELKNTTKSMLQEIAAGGNELAGSS